MAKTSIERELFDLAQSELNEKMGTGEVELNIAQLQSFSEQQHEQVAILFDLALEELIEPGAANKYLTLEQAATAKHAESPALNKALERFEAIVQIPFQNPTKKRESPRSTSYRRPLARAAVRAIPVSFGNRFRAFLLDTPFLAILSLLLLTVSLPLTDQGILGSLDALFVGDMLEKIPVLTILFKLLIPAAIIHGLIALRKKGITFGMRYLGLKVICSDGSLPTSGQLAIRALLIPASLITVPIAILFGSKGFIADIMTSTTVSRR